jgi:branched-chain amino acid transport system permease protein
MKRATPVQLAIVIGLGAAVLVVLLWLPTYYEASDVKLFSTALYTAMAAMGLNLLTGYSGQVSIGHGAFYGLGAYTTAILMKDHDWNFFATLPVSAALALVVGALIGFPALRVKGLYLALITLGLAALFPDIVNKYVEGTGGTVLVQPQARQLPTAPDWWPDDLNAPDQYRYVIVLIAALIMFVLMTNLVRSRFGRSVVAVRDHEAAAASVGINLAAAKVTVFALSALYAGLAGSFSVLINGLANTSRIETFTISIEFLVAVVIGGTATLLGPLVGAWIFVYLQDWTQTAFDNEVASPAIFGIALILLMYVLPDGLVGGGRRLLGAVRRRRPRDTLQPATT